LTTTYERRVTAFVDILGFGDLVLRADKKPELRNEIVSALELVNFVKQTGNGNQPPDLRAQNFSDSLILSSPADVEGFWQMMLSLDSLCWNLLDLGLLVRGGVTVGNIYHTDETVFGAAVNEAYRLESKIAAFPRIVLSKSALALADKTKSISDVYAAHRQERIIRDVDGVWFLNYLSDLAAVNRSDGKTNFDHRELFIEQGIHFYNIIQNKLNETVDHPDIYEKISWVARYWNRIVVPHHDWQEDYPLQELKLAGQE
jgi:hypothetical protein